MEDKFQQNLHSPVGQFLMYTSTSRCSNISIRASFETSLAYDDQVAKPTNFNVEVARLWNLDKRLAEKIRLKTPVLNQSDIWLEGIPSLKFWSINISHFWNSSWKTGGLYNSENRSISIKLKRHSILTYNQIETRKSKILKLALPQ